jgi:general secretion pathway protein A
MAEPAPSHDFPFGLQCDAFSIAPDPRFLYLSPQHQAALDTLQRGQQRGEGVLVLTGDVGAGKTTVWRAFLVQRPPDLDVACITNPHLSPPALLRRILQELQVELNPSAEPEPDLIDALHGHLLLAHAQGRRSLVVLDEAQSLSFAVLEQLRLLTNLVTDERKLIQIWLIGQPELREMLAMPETAPLSQRVVARCHISTLNPAETADYIAHRLAVAGYQGPELFDMDAVLAVHQTCQGLPRRINLLCERALALAAQAGEPQVSAATVARAAAVVFDDPTRRATLPPARFKAIPWRRWLQQAIAAAVVMLALAVIWQWVSTGPTGAGSQTGAAARSPDR